MGLLSMAELLNIFEDFGFFSSNQGSKFSLFTTRNDLFSSFYFVIELS